MDKMYCSNCGKEMVVGAKFCSGCGAKNIVYESKQKKENKEKWHGQVTLNSKVTVGGILKNKAVWLVASLLIVGLTLYFFNGYHSINGTWTGVITDGGETIPVQVDIENNNEITLRLADQSEVVDIYIGGTGSLSKVSSNTYTNQTLSLDRISVEEGTLADITAIGNSVFEIDNDIVIDSEAEFVSYLEEALGVSVINRDRDSRFVDFYLSGSDVYDLNDDAVSLPPGMVSFEKNNGKLKLSLGELYGGQSYVVYLEK